MITALVVDDHPALCEGIRRILKKIPGVSSCDIANNGKIAIEAMERQAYQLVLMDLKMPVMDGYQATDIIIEKFPETKIIVLSMVDSKREVLEMLRKGVHGYLLKSADQDEITRAILQVMDGHIYLSEDVSKIWTEHVMNQIMHEKKDIAHVELSVREKEIIRQICEQMTSAEIGDKLNISEATVKNHRTHIMQKLGTDNVIGIAMFAVRTGLFVP
jgi:two-component system response regulator DegU